MKTIITFVNEYDEERTEILAQIAKKVVLIWLIFSLKVWSHLQTKLKENMLALMVKPLPTILR